MSDPVFVSEEISETCIVQDGNGTIVHRAAQSGVPVIRRVDTEGKVHLTLRYTGRYIVPPYDPHDPSPST